jgi:NAD+ kinase
VNYRRIGVLYHPREATARRYADMLVDTVLQCAASTWLAETGDMRAVKQHMAETDLLVCVGGDGTVLWAARAAVPHPIPIVGINMGRLGFLSELEPEDGAPQLSGILQGDGQVEERAMLECAFSDAHRADGTRAIGLNDVVVGRAAPGRPVYLSVAVSGVHLARVRADAMIVSTATGSTAYNLSAGGPVLMPDSHELLLTPVAPHLSRMRPIVVGPDAVIEVSVETENAAIVSVDGQVDRPLTSGTTVVVRESEHVARFIRLGPPSDFFHKLAEHLNLSTKREQADG